MHIDSIFYSMSSIGSNYCSTISKLNALVLEYKNQFTAFTQLFFISAIIRVLFFISADGSDPHISLSSALLQVDRIVKVCIQQKLLQSITNLRESAQFLCLGEERINVLVLNLELDKFAGNNINNK